MMAMSMTMIDILFVILLVISAIGFIAFIVLDYKEEKELEKWQMQLHFNNTLHEIKKGK